MVIGSVLRRLAPLGLLLSVVGTASGAAAVPRIEHPVNDVAGVLTPGEAERIEARIVEHRDAHQVQIAVLIVRTTSGQPIADYSAEVAQQWGGGSRARDDGVLFTLALDDRAMRLEVGYGLEDQLSDSAANRILEGIRPELRAGRYADAVAEVVEAVIGRTGGTAAPLESSASSATPGTDPLADPDPYPEPTGTTPRGSTHLDEDDQTGAPSVDSSLGVYFVGAVFIAVLVVLVLLGGGQVVDARYGSDGVDRRSLWSSRRSSDASSRDRSSLRSSDASFRDRSSSRSSDFSSRDRSSSRDWSGGGGGFGGGGASSSW